MTDIAELKKQLADAEASERAKGDAEWKALKQRIKAQVEWSVRWEDKYTAHVALCYTPEALAEIEAMEVRYPKSYERVYEDYTRWRGMTYILIGNVLVQSGGGWCVLAIERKNTFRAWRELTDEQAASLRAGIVPDSIKAMGT